MTDQAWCIKKEGNLNKKNIVFQNKYFKLYEILKEENKKILKNSGKITTNLQ